jgi:hypothetical protein
MFRAEAFAILGDDLGHLGRCGHGWFARRRMRRSVAQFIQDLERLADGDLHRYEPEDIDRVRRTIDRGVDLIERWMSHAGPAAARPLAADIYRIRAIEEDICEHWRLQVSASAPAPAGLPARPSAAP